MPGTLPDLLAESARQFPERVAVHASARVTYAELDAAASAFASHLASLGNGGRRVGLLLPNVPQFAAAFYGILRSGASVVMLNPQYAPREIAEYTADAGVQTVVTVPVFAPLLPSAARPVLLDEMPGGAGGTFPTRSPEDDAVVIYTSAMEGYARGARLTHQNLIANLRSTVEAVAMNPDDRVVAALPLIHAFGLTVTLNSSLAAGAAVIPVERFNPVRVLDMFETERATIYCGVPAMYIALLAAAERRGVPDHSLRVAICGGAPLPVQITDRWESTFGMPLREGYGITEAGPVCLFNRLDRPNQPGTMGHPFPGVDVSIRDTWGSEVAPGEVGELCVTGENVFAGYVGDDGRNPRNFWGELLRTGDLVSAEPEGTVRFRGFLKAMFTRNGFNIYPRELERALQEDPRIARAEVYRIPDPAKENEVGLIVHPTPGIDLSEEDIRQLCRERLAVYKQPGTITIQTSGNQSDA